MDSDHFEPLATFTPALHDTGCDSGVRAGHGALWAEAQRPLCWQRGLARTLTTPTPGTSGLVGPSAPAELTVGPDLLRQAGADVRSWFDQGGSLMWIINPARGTGWERKDV
jgi:hypothetical protein